VTRLVLFARAADDLEQAFAHYFDVADLQLAERFRDAVGDALAHIERHPSTGSTRHSVSDAQPPLRFWTINKFPYAVFYFAHLQHPDPHIHIVRVLHQASDIPHHLQD
jgi:toxin ParE1/3/4